MAKRKVKKTTKATEKQKTPKVKSTIVKESKRVAYDRIQACVEALKLLKAAGEKTFSRDVVAAKADELHAAQHGGKSNLKEALWTSKYALRTLVAAELIQLQPDGSFLFKR